MGAEVIPVDFSLVNLKRRRLTRLCVNWSGSYEKAHYLLVYWQLSSTPSLTIVREFHDDWAKKPKHKFLKKKAVCPMPLWRVLVVLKRQLYVCRLYR